MVDVQDFCHCLRMFARSTETTENTQAPHGGAPADTQENRQRSWLDVVENAAIKPLGNSALIDSYNAVANGVNFVSSHVGAGDLMAQKDRWDVKDAPAYTAEWASQTAFRALGSLLPYTVAGTALGGGLRCLGASVGAEGTAAAIFKDQTLAYGGGAFAYDGMRNTNPGETHLGNALGGAAAISVFGLGNRWASKLGGAEGFQVRLATPAAGAAAQLLASDGIAQQRLPDKEELGQAVIGAYIVSPILPHAQKAIDRGIYEAQMRTPWGAAVDEYAGRKLTDNVAASPVLRQSLESNPWARIKIGSQYGDYSLDKNRIYLPEGKQTATELTRQLENLSDAKRGTYEPNFQAAASLLKSGDVAESWETYRRARNSQQTGARYVESVVDKELTGKPQLNYKTLGMEIGAWIAPGGVSNEYRARQEFNNFIDTQGKWRPGNALSEARPGSSTDGVKAFDPNPITEKPAGELTATEQENRVIRETATELVRHLQRAGYLTAFAGGAVRDGITGKTPKDYDIVTSATPDVIEKLFTELGYKITDEKGTQFGVNKLNIDGVIYDIATLRNDGDYGDGRRPDGVAFVPSLYEDGSRRDFKFNAMYEEPTTRTVYDFFGGKEDLAKKQISAVGDPELRFTEDHLRMVRAATRAAKDGLDVEPQTLEAMQRMASTINRLLVDKDGNPLIDEKTGKPIVDKDGNPKRAIGMERIKDELIGVFSGAYTLKGLDVLEKSGLRHQIIPEYDDMFGPRAMQDPKWHPEGLASTHTNMVIDHLPADAPWQVKFAAYLHDIAKPMTQKIHEDGRISNHNHDEEGAKIAQQIVERLKMTNEDQKRIVTLVREHMRMHGVRDFRPSKLHTLIKNPYFEDQVMLQHADVMGTGRPESDRLADSHRDWLYAKRTEFENAPKEQRLGAPPIVSGDFFVQLMKEANVPAGPRRNDIRLAAIYAQQEGGFNPWLQQGLDGQAAARAWLEQNVAEFKK
jgi:poly(A) polymerase